MIVLVVFLILQVSCSLAIEFKCTSPSANKIEIICEEAYEKPYYGYYYNIKRQSRCSGYNSRRDGKTEIEFKKCSMSYLPTEALSQIGIYNFSVDISNLNGNALNATNFLGLRSLQELIANHNRLRGFVENMFVNTNLNYLDVAYNQFTEIETIGRSGARELKTLKISNNELKDINATSFKGLDRLEVVDLSFNNLTIIGDETFDLLTELKNLSLAHTHLLHIDFGLLSHLENLQSLDISHTTIRMVEIGVHSAVFKKLQKINMTASEIMEIDGLTQQIFPSLIHLDLKCNRLNCSHLESILSSFDLNRLIYKLDPSSKIKKGKSYRGIACGQFAEIQSTIPLIEPKIEYSMSALSSENIEKTSTTWYEEESTYSSIASYEISSVEYETESTDFISDENEMTMIKETTTKTGKTTETSSINANIGSLAVANDHYKLDQIHETLHIMKIIITLLAITLILTVVYIILYENQKSISNRLRNAYVIRFRQNLSNNDENDSVMKI